jgi:3-hydroxybutyryl-CoA dehydrogenase
MIGDQPLRRAAVIGSGMMGPGIGYTLALTGCEVTIFARTDESVARGLAGFDKAVSMLAGAGSISTDEASGIRERCSGATDLKEATAGADLVIESIPEDLELKRACFTQLEGLCRRDTIMTSNTSGIPVAQIAAALRYRDRFAVTHFWNPPHLMPLVEVVKGEETAPETVETLTALLLKGGKKPVTVLKDTPGQLGNRLLHALIREAIHIVEQGIATVEDVDTAIKNGLGRRFPVYGVMEHQDIAGLDMVLAIQNYLCPSLCNDTEPARVLREKVSGGSLGAKSGSGFYDWTKRDVGTVIDKRDTFLLELLKKR